MIRFILSTIGLIISLSLFVMIVISIWASPVNALESRELSRHGAWTVSIDIYDDGSLHCAMNTDNDVAAMAISVNAEDNYSLLGIVNGVHTQHSLIDLQIRIDTELWNFTNVSATNLDGHVFWTTVMPAREGFQFRQDIIQGRMLWFDRTNSNVPFSLHGASAAMLDLDQCRRMIQPNF